MVLKVEGRRKHFSVGQAKYMQWKTADYPREARNTFEILEFGFSSGSYHTTNIGPAVAGSAGPILPPLAAGRYRP